MFLPIPLLLALLVVATNVELMPALPGSLRVERLLPLLALLALPAVLAALAQSVARRTLTGGRRGLVPPRALLRLSALATPIVVHAIYSFGDYTDLVDELAPMSHLGRLLLGVLPAFVAELPRLPWSTLAGTLCDLLDEGGLQGPVAPEHLPDHRDVAAFLRLRLGGPLLIALPLLLLGASLDLLQLHRGLYVFVLVTSPGITLGAIAFLLLVVMVLPFWFRLAFGVVALPEPLGARLRAVAAALGFRGDRLHLLPTGMRALNAMLVGPLPVGRSLCLTDGLVRELDAESLAGVVAHEVGHAKNNHPAVLLVLVVVVPLLLLTGLRAVDLESLDVVVRSALLVGGLGATWFAVRALAHRFEHEADVASVDALGAGPCSRALMVVSRLATPVPHGLLGRIFTLHPDEPSRWQVMQRYEQEPAFRAAFLQRSRRLRQAVVVALLAALAVALWVGSGEWRLERVVWCLHRGDHRQALADAAVVRDVPPHWREAWQRLGEDLAVVRELAPASTDWAGAQAALAPAWARGEQVLLASGPAAARPWFAMALGVLDAPSPVLRAVHAYCEAASDNEPERMAAIAAIVRRLGAPPPLAAVFHP